ncbi:MAG: type II toxin-antitoxin system YafQ family toxin, partial [Lachnospiraceae bacterium]|nr:type II toxin-antitoxin system YafQ family toxin [Lachnospiraceae bacterium]
MLNIEFTSRFKKDYKTMVKRGVDPKKLEKVLVLLSSEKPLPKSYKDHDLVNSRNYKNMRECHIAPDWL